MVYLRINSYIWINRFQAHYERCQRLVKDYHHTEQRPSDNYLIMAAHILWELWTDPNGGDDSGKRDMYFWKAVVLLEYLLKLSPSNYNARFLLVKFFNQAGESETLSVAFFLSRLFHS